MAKRILAARHYVKAGSPLAAIAAKARPGIRRDVREALRQLGTLIPRDQAVRQARAGDWDGLKKLVRWGHFREVLKAPLARIARVRQAGAEVGVRKINGAFARARRRVHFHKIAKDAGDRFNFDLYSMGTVENLRQAQDVFIRELETSARDSIDTIVMNGARRGLDPEQIVADIRTNIGLTDRQSQAVLNYGNALDALDPAALERQLRNRGFDDDVVAAIEAGEPLGAAMRDQLVKDYRENYLDYRAMTIARTESTRAVNAGLQDAYQQAIDRGALPEDAVRQHWLLGDKPCPVCESIPPANSDGIAIGETFDSIDGPQDAPPVHPSCECEVEIVTDLDKVPDAPAPEEEAPAATEDDEASPPAETAGDIFDQIGAPASEFAIADELLPAAEDEAAAAEARDALTRDMTFLDASEGPAWGVDWQEIPEPERARFEPESFRALNFDSMADQDAARGAMADWYRTGQVEGFASDEVVAMNRYSGSDYREINKAEVYKALRSGEVRETPLLRGLDGAFAKAAFPQDALAYRGVSSEGWRYVEAAIRGDNMNIMIDPAYMSISAKRGVAESFAGSNRYVFEIYVPRGSRAISLQPISNHPGEMEIMLPRGSRLQFMGNNARSGSPMFLLVP